MENLNKSILIHEFRQLNIIIIIYVCIILLDHFV